MSKIRAVSSAACIVVLGVISGCASTQAIKQNYASVGDDIGNAIVLSAGAMVPSFDDDTIDCDWGQTSANPVIVGNQTTQSQTFTITINDQLAKMANWVPYSEYSAAVASGGGLSGCNIDEGASGTFTITVPPDTAGLAGYILAGGSEFGINEPGSEDHNLSIGAGGTQWYDYWLHTDGGTFSFQNWTLNYGETGGTDSAQNVQSGLFNGVVCDDSAGNISFADPVQLTTPYVSHTDNGWEFDNGTAMCFAFLQ